MEEEEEEKEEEEEEEEEKGGGGQRPWRERLLVKPVTNRAPPRALMWPKHVLIHATLRHGLIHATLRHGFIHRLEIPALRSIAKRLSGKSRFRF